MSMVPRAKFEDDVAVVLVDTTSSPPKSQSFAVLSEVIQFKEQLVRDFVGNEFKDSVFGEYNAVGVKYFDLEYDRTLGMAELTNRMVLWQSKNAYVEYL